MRKFKKMLAALIAGGLIATMAACTTEADTVNHNLTKEADSFKVQRRISFVNGITDKEMLRVEGRCSYEVTTKQVKVLCKVGKKSYVRHAMTRSDNMTAIMEQTVPGEVEPNHYVFVVRPQTLIPNLDLQTDNTKE